MSKPIHPIRKMRQHLGRLYWYDVRNRRFNPRVEEVIARHIKPLLDALWDDHEICRVGVDKYGDKPTCKTCRLVAAWREKL